MKLHSLTSIVCLCVFHFISAQDQTDSPYFNVIGSDSSGVSLSLSSTDVTATISGVIANVEVVQTYINSGDSEVNATYVFPMSTKAAIYAMEMNIGDRHVVAEIRRKAEADSIFNEAAEDGLTATLLEQERPNVFQMTLANVYPGDTIQVIMDYVELLTPEAGVYSFRFPSVVGPRFSTESEPWVHTALQSAESVQETALNLNVNILAGMPLEVHSPSHEAEFNYIGTSASTIIETEPGADIEVDFTLDGSQIETGLLRYEGEEENFFLSIIQPPSPDVLYEAPLREYIFIMDVSGSMNGQPIEVSRQLISDLLNDLNYQDRFNIIFFAGGAATFAPNSVAVTDENIASALDMIDNMNAGGSTQLLPALQQALDMTGTADFSRTFVILTDGFVTVETEAFNLIRENMDKANFFSFGIGANPNVYIIEGIAYVGEGESFIASNQTDAYEVAERFKDYIDSPVLTNIEANYSGVAIYDVEPLTVPDVFADRPIIIYGKYENETEGTIELTGDYGDTEISSTLNFSDYSESSDQNSALRYLWARKRIKLMSDYGIASNESDTISIEEEITLLGLQYSLITEYTSFVAVDSSAVSQDSGGDEGDVDGWPIDIDEFTSESNEGQTIKVIDNLLSRGQALTIVVSELGLSQNQGLTIRVFNSSGILIQELPFEFDQLGKELNIPLEALASGIYFVSVHSPYILLDSAPFVVE